jgi:hypothetical protein
MLGRRSDVRALAETDLSGMGGRGSQLPPTKESTLTERWLLIGINLMPAVEGGRSSMGRYSSSMMQLDKWTELKPIKTTQS